MKILITIYEKPEFGGAEVSTENLIKGLQDLGHDVIVASANDWSEVTKTFMFKQFRLKFPIFYLQQKYLAKFFKKIILDNNIDVVHSQDRLTTPGAIEAAKGTGTPIVVNFRDYWFACPNSSCCTPDGEMYDTYGFKQLIKERPFRIPWNLYKMIELKRIRYLLDKADVKIAVSKCVLNKLEINGILRGIIIPITRDLSRFLNKQKLDTNKEVRLTYVGNLATNKGIMEILKWMPMYLDKNQNYRFMIVGDGVLKPKIKEMIKGNDQIALIGKVTHKDMVGIYDFTDILLFPSIWEEPYGGVVLEAMASGVTVIASDRGGHIDIIKHKFNGYLVNPKNSWSWIHWLDHFNPSLGIVARETIKKEYDLKKIIKEIEEVYLWLEN